MVPWTRMIQPANGISIGSGVSAQHTRVPNTQTGRPRYVRRSAIGRIRAIRPNNKQPSGNDTRQEHGDKCLNSYKITTLPLPFDVAVQPVAFACS